MCWEPFYREEREYKNAEIIKMKLEGNWPQKKIE